MKLFFLIWTLLASVLLTAVNAHAASLSLKAERTEYHAPSGKITPNAVALTWRLNEGGVAPMGYEVQRRLFPWGWRKVGHSSGVLWLDRRPSRRASWYRVRPVYEDASGEWSPKAFAPAVK